MFDLYMMNQGNNYYNQTRDICGTHNTTLVAVNRGLEGPSGKDLYINEIGLDPTDKVLEFVITNSELFKFLYEGKIRYMR